MLSNDIRNYRAMDSLYIAHHGILGQKWGHKSGPPYPLKPGDHTAAEKKAASEAGVKVGKSSSDSSGSGVELAGDKDKPGLIGSLVQGVKQHQIDKKRTEALKKARAAKEQKAKEKAEAEAHEAAKQKALNSGDYNEIQKYAKEASYNELQTALNKADALKRLDKAIVDNTPVEPTIQDKIDDAASKIRTATNLATNGIDAWNKIATVWNTFADEDSMMPEIGKNFKEEQEKKRKEKQEKARQETIEAIQKRNNPEEILKNRELFTNKEFQDARARIINESTIRKELNAQKTAAETKKEEKKAEKEAKKDKKEASTMKDQVSQVNAMLLRNMDNDTPINIVVNLPDFSKQEEEVKKIWLPR